MANYWKYFIGFLVLVLVLVAFVTFSLPDKNFHLITCDVGQGDAILAIYGDSQILVDGGPNSKVLGCLARFIPFWDRSIEVVINTHPQTDHFEGLIDVFKWYEVKTFIATPLASSSQDYRVLESLVGSEGVKVINPTSGTKLRSSLIYLDILNPSEKFLKINTSRSSSNVLGSSMTQKNLNEFSIVTLLHFKDFDALLTGDIDPEISDEIAQEIKNGGYGVIEYLKVPHHGSKNGLSQKLLDVVRPAIAVISVGVNNSYGHPTKEVLDMLAKARVKLLRTDEVGDIEVVSDGDRVWISK